MKLSKIGVSLLITLTAVFAISSPAVANDEITDAITSLNSGKSYVGAGKVDMSTFDGTNIALVVLPDSAFDNFGPAAVARDIYDDISSSYETVIVINGDEPTLAGVAPNEIAAEVQAIISQNKNESNPLEALKQDKQELLELTEATAKANEPTVDLSGLAVPGLIGGGALGLAALVTAIALTIKRKNANKIKAITTKAVKNDELKRALEEFAELANIHNSNKYSTGKAMKSIVIHLNELFTRLERKAAGNAKSLAAVNYTDTLKRLNSALGKDYYLDIATSPNLWDGPRHRMDEVEEALTVVNNQVIENIKQINSSRDLDFRVSLESILSSVDQPSVATMIKKEKN